MNLKHTTTITKAHSKAVKSMLLKGQTLYSSGADAVIKEWDVPNQKTVNEVKDKGEVNAIFISDNMLFSGSNDKTVKVNTTTFLMSLLTKFILQIYDTRTFKCTTTLASHTRAVKCLYVLGNYLFSGSNDQQILVSSLNHPFSFLSV